MPKRTLRQERRSQEKSLRGIVRREFAAMLVLTDEQRREAMSELEKTAENWCGEQVKGLSISCGYASSREFPSENITELIKISDERMYAAKDEYYRKSGNDRRRR